MLRDWVDEGYPVNLEGKRKIIMNQWDYYRKRIAEGDKSSLPRDWFESVLDYYEERIGGKEDAKNQEISS